MAKKEGELVCSYTAHVLAESGLVGADSRYTNESGHQMISDVRATDKMTAQ